MNKYQKIKQNILIAPQKQRVKDNKRKVIIIEDEEKRSENVQIEEEHDKKLNKNVNSLEKYQKRQEDTNQRLKNLENKQIILNQSIIKQFQTAKQIVKNVIGKSRESKSIECGQQNYNYQQQIKLEINSQLQIISQDQINTESTNEFQGVQNSQFYQSKLNSRKKSVPNPYIKLLIITPLNTFNEKASQQQQNIQEKVKQVIKIDKKSRNISNRTPINVREYKWDDQIQENSQSPKSTIRINSVVNRNDYEQIQLPPIQINQETSTIQNKDQLSEQTVLNCSKIDRNFNEIAQQQKNYQVKESLREKLEKLRILNEKVQNMGGLGPSNVGSPMWKNQIAMKQKILQYSQKNYLVNKLILQRNKSIDEKNQNDSQKSLIAYEKEKFQKVIDIQKIEFYNLKLQDVSKTNEDKSKLQEIQNKIQDTDQKNFDFDQDNEQKKQNQNIKHFDIILPKLNTIL